MQAYIFYVVNSMEACVVQVEIFFFFFYPSIGSQVLLVAQFKRLFLLFLPIVPSEQTEALPAAQKPANSLQRHSNEVKWVVFYYPGRFSSTFTASSQPQVTPRAARERPGRPLHRLPREEEDEGSREFLLFSLSLAPSFQAKEHVKRLAAVILQPSSQPVKWLKSPPLLSFFFSSFQVSSWSARDTLLSPSEKLHTEERRKKKKGD